MTWEVHQERALSVNASLSCIQDQSEFDFVMHMLSNSNSINSRYNGGVQKNENGDFIWVSQV